MENSALAWLGLTLMFIVIQACYSMLEMASVSFDKARLQYYVDIGKRQARWLNFLLEKPARLFGTTLIAVNAALQIGSECSRKFYMALDLPADIAPLTQIFLVVIFAELAPMLAGRKHSEHVVMLGIFIVYFTSRLFTPLIWLIGLISRLANFLFSGGAPVEGQLFTRDELQRIFETSDEATDAKESLLNQILSNIFKFRHKMAYHIMEPLNTVQMAPSNCTVKHMRKLLHKAIDKVLPVYHHTRSNIIGIILPRDLLKASDDDRIRDSLQPPWFVTYNTNVIDILKQFRDNRKRTAVVLNRSGAAIGLLSLNDVLEEIFGESQKNLTTSSVQRLVERQFPGTLFVKDFNSQFKASIECSEEETLAQLMARHLGHPPEKGESTRIDKFEFKIVEGTLLGARVILVRTIL